MNKTYTIPADIAEYFSTIYKILVNELDVPEHKISTHANLIYDLNLDSLDIVFLRELIETEYALPDGSMTTPTFNTDNLTLFNLAVITKNVVHATKIKQRQDAALRLKQKMK